MAEKPYDRLDGVIWYDGRLVPWGDATLHVLSHGLHYASAVFEGERAYGGEIFKCTEHSERLKRSAQVLDFDIPYSVAEIDAAKRLVLEKNGQKDAYVRPVAWRGSEMMGVSAQNNKIHLAIATWQWPSYFDPVQRLKGIRLDLADYRRPDPKTAPARAKAAGLYMICTISKHIAERKGYADAMMLDWQGRVAECTGANIFFINDGKIHTPIADCFLDGITRQTAIELAKKRGIEVIERRIMPDELTQFSECFITGSAAEVTAVSEILRVLHHRQRGRGHGGVRDRALEIHARRHHPATHGRLHRRGAAQGQEEGGLIRRRGSVDWDTRWRADAHDCGACAAIIASPMRTRRAPRPSAPTLCAVTRAPSSRRCSSSASVSGSLSPALRQSSTSRARCARLNSSMTRRAG